MPAPSLRLRGDAGVAELSPGEAVDQGHAVDEKAGGEGAHEEVLEGPLRAARAAPPAPGQDVGRHREGLDPDQQRQQVVGVGHHHHARDPEQDQGVELAELEAVLPHEGAGQQHGEERRHQEGDVTEEGHPVGDPHALQDGGGRGRRFPLAGQHEARGQAAGGGQPHQPLPGVAGAEGLGQQHEAPHPDQDQHREQGDDLVQVEAHGVPPGAGGVAGAAGAVPSAGAWAGGWG